MAKIRRDEVVGAALELLDEVGLDALSTRRLAQKLGIESATLYWHFRDKSVLLAEMAGDVLVRHHTLGIPADTVQWPAWFADNARSFRRALMAHRDGARLHAGTTPDPDAIERVLPKVAYLVRAGFTQQEAGMALLAEGQYTLGCVLEEQARQNEAVGSPGADLPREMPQRMQGKVTMAVPDPEMAFEFGLGLIVDGLRGRLAAAG